MKELGYIPCEACGRKMPILNPRFVENFIRNPKWVERKGQELFCDICGRTNTFTRYNVFIYGIEPIEPKYKTKW